MLRRKFFMAVAAAAVAGLFGPASARAAFTFEAKIIVDGVDQGPITTTTSVNGAGSQQLVGGFSAGDIALDFIATSNINTSGGNVAAFVFDTTTDIVNKGNTNHLVEIQIIANPFTSPGQAGMLMTAVNSVTGLGSDPNAGPIQYTDPNATGLDVYARITPDMTDLSTTVRTLAGSYASDPLSVGAFKTPGVNFTRGSQFGITNVISLGLDGGRSQQITSQSVVTATPAPATAILALAGAPLFGAFGWMRRRKAVVA